MADYLRLRQLCLAAPKLENLIEDLKHVFRIEVCRRDPAVGKWGLENVLFPIGTTFLEIVRPTRENTAAGRFIERTKGHGGYMAIFQAPDPRRRQRHVEAMGMRIALVIDHDGYQDVQLHPADSRATFLEFGHSPGGDDRMGTWWPAGTGWPSFVRTDDTKRVVGIELESPDPESLAAHWAKLIEVPVGRDNGDPLLTFEDGTIRFVKGDTECFGTMVVEVADPEATLGRAVECGYRVRNNAFHLGGIFFRVQ